MTTPFQNKIRGIIAFSVANLEEEDRANRSSQGDAVRIHPGAITRISWGYQADGEPQLLFALPTELLVDDEVPLQAILDAARRVGYVPDLVPDDWA